MTEICFRPFISFLVQQLTIRDVTNEWQTIANIFESGWADANDVGVFTPCKIEEL